MRDEAMRSVSGRVEVSHPDKVLFPDDGITKGELAGYYETVAARMLPLISGRPVAMQRFPNGIGTKGFFQKQVSDSAPEWVERVTAPNRRTRQATIREEVVYMVCRETDDLVYLANQGCVTPHVWPSRAPDIFHPDQLIFDLDPASPDLGLLRQTAASLRGLLEELGLPAFLKSSGSRGLHVIVPLTPSAETDAVKVFSLEVAETLVARDPENLTVEGRIADRHGRLFLDIGGNGYAQHVAAPYAVRALPGAPVSTPLEWSELDSFEPRQHTLRTIADRLDAADPWADLDGSATTLNEAHARLSELRG